MNLGEFREWTKDLPDDTDLVIWEDGDVTWYELIKDKVSPATPIHDRAVVQVSMGQQVELEFDLAIRTGIDDW